MTDTIDAKIKEILARYEEEDDLPPVTAQVNEVPVYDNYDELDDLEYTGDLEYEPLQFEP